MEKRFKEFTLYEETMGVTTSDSTTPLLGLDNVSVPKGTVCPLCGSKDDKHGWVSGGYRCPNGWSKHT